MLVAGCCNRVKLYAVGEQVLDDQDAYDQREVDAEDVADRLGSVHDDPEVEAKFYEHMKAFSCTKELFVTTPHLSPPFSFLLLSHPNWASRTVIQEWEGWDEHKRDAHRADLVVEELRTSKVKGDLRGMAAAIIAQLHSEDKTGSTGTAAAAAAAAAAAPSHHTSGTAHSSGSSEKTKKKLRELESTESDTSESSSTEHSGQEDNSDKTTAGRAQKRPRQEEPLDNDEEDEEEEDGLGRQPSSGALGWDLLGCGNLVPNTSVSELMHHWRLSAADIWIPRVWGLHDAEEFHSMLLRCDSNAAADTPEAQTAEGEGEEGEAIDAWSDLELVKLGDSVWVRAPALTSVTMGSVYAIYTLPGRTVPLVNVFDAASARGMTLTVEDIRALSEKEQTVRRAEGLDVDDTLVKWLQKGGDVMRARAIVEWETMDAEERRAFMRTALQRALQAEATGDYRMVDSTDAGAAWDHQQMEPPLLAQQQPQQPQQAQEQAQQQQEEKEEEEERTTMPTPKREKEEKAGGGGATEVVSRQLVQNYLQTQKELLSQIMALCRQLSPDGTLLFS